MHGQVDSTAWQGKLTCASFSFYLLLPLLPQIRKSTLSQSSHGTYCHLRLCATKSILMMQYPASLLVLTANTLYKPSGVFLFCFLKNKQAKPPTFLRRRQNLIQPLRNLPIPGPRRKVRQGFEARIWLYNKTSQQAYCGFAATFCLHIYSPHRNVPAWAPISSSSPCFHQTKLSSVSHLM